MSKFKVGDRVRLTEARKKEPLEDCFNNLSSFTIVEVLHNDPKHNAYQVMVKYDQPVFLGIGTKKHQLVTGVWRASSLELAPRERTKVMP